MELFLNERWRLNEKVDRMLTKNLPRRFLLSVKCFKTLKPPIFEDTSMSLFPERSKVLKFEASSNISGGNLKNNIIS